MQSQWRISTFCDKTVPYFKVSLSVSQGRCLFATLYPSLQTTQMKPQSTLQICRVRLSEEVKPGFRLRRVGSKLRQAWSPRCIVLGPRYSCLPNIYEKLKIVLFLVPPRRQYQGDSVRWRYCHICFLQIPIEIKIINIFILKIILIMNNILVMEIMSKGLVWYPIPEIRRPQLLQVSKLNM